TVACQWIAAACPAVRKIDQDFQSLPHNLMALFAMHVHDKAHAAGIVLERRIVQTLALTRVEWKLRLHRVHLSHRNPVCVPCAYLAAASAQFDSPCGNRFFLQCRVTFPVRMTAAVMSIALGMWIIRMCLPVRGVTVRIRGKRLALAAEQF